ncbi:MAG: hypothetical protein OXG25_01220 [Gammaproteobacteria bacterium]|nr:hypothetical protein [Gammaproteobacteria bacterium]
MAANRILPDISMLQPAMGKQPFSEFDIRINPFQSFGRFSSGPWKSVRYRQQERDRPIEIVSFDGSFLVDA